MSENRVGTTALYVLVAGALLWLAAATRPRVSRDPGVFNDSRQLFFSQLVAADGPKVDAPKAIEIIDASREDPFRVQFADNTWKVASQYNYPADAADRLKNTAGALFGLRKDVIVSDRKDDHALFQVRDPLDKTGVPEGQGKRIRLQDKNGNIIADLIVGRPVEGKPGFRYVRVPDKDRTYQAEVGQLDVTTKFTDWIDTDLLRIASGANGKAIELQTRHTDLQEGLPPEAKPTAILVHEDKANTWKLENLGEKEATQEDKARQVYESLRDLKITGVRPLPASFKTEGGAQRALVMALGYDDPGSFGKTSKGRLVSSDGEAVLALDNGLNYHLYFGSLVLGEAESKGDTSKTPAGQAVPPKERKPSEDRFVIVQVSFDETLFSPIPDPVIEEPKEGDAKTKEAEKQRQLAVVQNQRQERERKLENGRKQVEQAKERFGKWVYIIPNESFKKIALTRAELVTEKKAEVPPTANGAGTPPGFPAMPGLPGMPALPGLAAPKHSATTNEPAATIPAVGPTEAEAKKAEEKLAVKETEAPKPNAASKPRLNSEEPKSEEAKTAPTAAKEADLPATKNTENAVDPKKEDSSKTDEAEKKTDG